MRKRIAILICALFLIFVQTVRVSLAAVGKPKPDMKRVVEKKPIIRVPRQTLNTHVRPMPTKTEEADATPEPGSTGTAVTRTPADGGETSQPANDPTAPTQPQAPPKPGMKASTILYLLLGLLIIIGGGYSASMLLSKAKEHKERDF